MFLSHVFFGSGYFMKPPVILIIVLEHIKKRTIDAEQSGVGATIINIIIILKLLLFFTKLTQNQAIITFPRSFFFLVIQGNTKP